MNSHRPNLTYTASLGTTRNVGLHSTPRNSLLGAPGWPYHTAEDDPYTALISVLESSERLLDGSTTLPGAHKSALSGVLAAAAAVVHELVSQNTFSPNNNTVLKVQALVRHIQALVESSVAGQNRLGIFQDRISNLSPSASTQSLNGPYEEPLPVLESLNLGQSGPGPRLDYEDDDGSEFEDDIDTTAALVEKMVSIVPPASNTPTRSAQRQGRPKPLFRSSFDAPLANDYASREVRHMASEKALDRRSLGFSANSTLLSAARAHNDARTPQRASEGFTSASHLQKRGITGASDSFFAQNRASQVPNGAPTSRKPRTAFLAPLGSTPTFSGRTYDDVFLDGAK